IPHYFAGRGRRLKAGMIFTIEPMINVGTHETELMDDDWTVKTKDRALTAQFEHTILVTQSGAEVLTDRKRVLKGSEDLPWSKLGPLGTRAAHEARHSSSTLGSTTNTSSPASTSSDNA